MGFPFISGSAKVRRRRYMWDQSLVAVVSDDEHGLLLVGMAPGRVFRRNPRA
jgi:hypothetical protein